MPISLGWLRARASVELFEDQYVYQYRNRAISAERRANPGTAPYDDDGAASDTPAYDADAQKPVEIEPVEIDGVWRQQWSVAPLTEDELAELQRLRDEAAAALIPKSCTRRQGRLALLAFGLLDEAEAAIAAITDPVQMREAEIEYEADTWERGNPFLAGLWTQLGGTPQSLDEAFVLAVTL
jgi:hypothetical protein